MLGRLCCCLPSVRPVTPSQAFQPSLSPSSSILPSQNRHVLSRDPLERFCAAVAPYVDNGQFNSDKRVSVKLYVKNENLTFLERMTRFSDVSDNDLKIAFSGLKQFYDEAQNITDLERKKVLLEIHKYALYVFLKQTDSLKEQEGNLKKRINLTNGLRDVPEEKQNELNIDSKRLSGNLSEFTERLTPLSSRIVSRDEYFHASGLGSDYVRECKEKYLSMTNSLRVLGNFLKQREGEYQHIVGEKVLEALENNLFRDHRPVFWDRYLNDLKAAAHFSDKGSCSLTTGFEKDRDFCGGSQVTFLDTVNRLKAGHSALFFGAYTPKSVQSVSGERVYLGNSHAFIARFYAYMERDSAKKSWCVAIQNYGLGQLFEYTLGEEGKVGSINLDLKQNFGQVQDVVGFLYDYFQNEHKPQELRDDIRARAESFGKGNPPVTLPFLYDATFFSKKDMDGGFCTSFSFRADLKQSVGAYVYEGQPINNEVVDSVLSEKGKLIHKIIKYAILEYLKKDIGPAIDDRGPLKSTLDSKLESLRQKISVSTISGLEEPFQSKLNEIKAISVPAALPTTTVEPFNFNSWWSWFCCCN